MVSTSGGTASLSVPSSPPAHHRAVPRRNMGTAPDSSSPTRGAVHDMEAGRTLLPSTSKKRVRSFGNLAAASPRALLGSLAERRLPHGCLMRSTLLAVLCAALVFGWSSFAALRHGSSYQAAGVGGSRGSGMGWRALFRGASTTSRQQRAETLVVYIYSKSDPEYERNLHFFVRQGIRANDGCYYVIVVQQGDGVEESDPLPTLPANARYEFHENKCFDWGTIGWLLESGRVDPRIYTFFMFMNSSTRGPFLPAYWPTGKHWSTAFTDRLTNEVKLVGSTISCEGTLKDGKPTGEKRQTPHVQSYAMATDQVGLAVLEGDGRVFGCYDSIHDTIWHSELGSSLAILDAGYNLDSLMLRYQGIDWHNESYWKCNAEENPYKENSLDGTNLQPLEVMFVKVKGFLLDLQWSSATAAQALDRWAMHEGEAEAIVGNSYLANLPEVKRHRAMGMALRGVDCFDANFYKQRNKDLPPMGDPQLWAHFVLHGQFEGRPFRFSCGAPPRHAAAGPALAPPISRAEASEVTPKQLVKIALKAAQSFQIMVGNSGSLAKTLAALDVPIVGSHAARHHRKKATKRRTQMALGASSGNRDLPPGEKRKGADGGSKGGAASAVDVSSDSLDGGSGDGSEGRFGSGGGSGRLEDIFEEFSSGSGQLVDSAADKDAPSRSQLKQRAAAAADDQRHQAETAPNRRRQEADAGMQWRRQKATATPAVPNVEDSSDPADSGNSSKEADASSDKAGADDIMQAISNAIGVGRGAIDGGTLDATEDLPDMFDRILEEDASESQAKGSVRLHASDGKSSSTDDFAKAGRRQRKAADNGAAVGRQKAAAAAKSEPWFDSGLPLFGDAPGVGTSSRSIDATWKSAR